MGLKDLWAAFAGTPIKKRHAPKFVRNNTQRGKILAQLCSGAYVGPHEAVKII